jgi:4-hydroxybenzoate polyprenyltransferase
VSAEGGVKPGKLKVLLELVKFEHSVFALPYAFIGALYGTGWIGRLSDAYVDGTLVGLERVAAKATLDAVVGRWAVGYDTLSGAWPTWSALLWITVAMVGARAFAFVVNRAVDKEIDSRNPRTADRAIPAGLVKAWELWLFAAVMLAAYLHAVFQLAPITHWLWPIPLATFLVYPYTKRFTPLCHYWLGLCLGLAPVAGWVAVGGPVGSPGPWVLGAAVMLWTAGFDIIYATQDVACDLRDKIHSMPADLGIAAALSQTRAAHAATVALLAFGGYLLGAGVLWFVGIGVAAALLWYENSIVKADDLTRVNAAFFTVNGVIAVIVLIGALADRLQSF